MDGRGRRSGAALALVSQHGPLAVCERQAPPDELTDEERHTWLAVTEALPAEWFGTETLPLLSQYCRHIVHAKRIGQMVAAFVEGKDTDGNPVVFDLESFDRLSRMQERESRAIAMLATKMRISQQSTYDKSKRKGVAGKRPWEDV